MAKIVPEKIESTEITIRVITNRKTYEKKFTDINKAKTYHDGLIEQIQ